MIQTLRADRRGTASMEYALVTAGAVATVALLPLLLGPVLHAAVAAIGTGLDTQIAALVGRQAMPARRMRQRIAHTRRA